MGPKEVTGLEIFNLLTKNLHNHPVKWVLLFPPYGWGRIRGSGVKQLPKTVIKYQGWDLNLDSQPSFYQPCTQLWYHAMSKRSRDQKTWSSSLSHYKRTSKNLLSLCFLLHLSGVVTPILFSLGEHEKAQVWVLVTSYETWPDLRLLSCCPCISAQSDHWAPLRKEPWLIYP